MSEDRALRELFHRLRRVDLAAAPDLDSLLERPPRRHSVAAPWLALAGAVALVAVLLVLGRPPAPEPVPALSEWRSPTEYLLRSPGESFLRDVPEVGRINEEVFSCDDCF